MSQFRVYAPLSQFIWMGQDFAVAPGVEIRRRVQGWPELRGLEERLAVDERDSLLLARHWLTFEWSTGKQPSAAEVVSLFLLALWLSRPTRTHVELRFEVRGDPGAPPGSWARLLDRFNWVPGATADAVTDADLAEATLFFPLLRDRCLQGGRLQNALSLTSAGCMAHTWQIAFICHAAAAESVLTYGTGAGITRRLALAYACLVETSTADRNRAFSDFRNLYSVRSDIMHGRAHNVAAADRLPTLARFDEILRKLWRAVLTSSSPGLIQSLEGTDGQRAALFCCLQRGYTPPP